jgi:hypothetical protein
MRLDVGLMQPAFTLAALATSGIAARSALAPPDRPGADAFVLVALRGDEIAPVPGPAN